MAVEIGFGKVGRVAGGADHLPQAAAGTLAARGGRLALGAVVVRIEQDDAAVRVAYESEGRRAMIVADRAIVTVPASVLSRIVFSPSLSVGKVRAAEGTHHADVVRIFAEIDGAPWRDRGEAAAVDSDGPLGRVHEETPFDATGPILGFYVDGPRARALDRASDEDIERLARAELERAHPGIEPRIRRIAYHRWSRDRWAMGAYAYFGPGEWVPFRRALAAPEGRVHFAGDATSHRPGFMHGAIRSAYRVVEEIGPRQETRTP